MGRRARRTRWPVFAVVAVALAGSGTAYAVTSGGTTAHYRTTLATTGDVERTLSTSGTVDAAQRADLEFAASGTVARLLVAVGDTVRAGQVLAVLDTGELEAAVTRARADVAKAVAQLAADRTAQADAVAAAASAATASSAKPKSSTPATTAPSATAGASAALAAIKALQDDVLAAQSAAGTAIAAAKDALAAQTKACATAFQDTTPNAQGGAASASATSDNAACTAALAMVRDRQDAVAGAQDTLAKALSALADSLTRAFAALQASVGTPTGSTPKSSTPSSSTPTSSTPSSSTPSSSSPTGSSGTVSAARLASDQAQVEKAKAGLVGAQQKLGQATVRSTRSGKVVALDAAVGDDVSAGDTAAVVVGGTAVSVQATVDQAKIGQVKVGQAVRVSTPGSSSSVEGHLSAIGLVADSSSGTTTYPVTVLVENPTIALPDGSTAMLEIVLGTVKHVVTVPISAVVKRGTSAVVQTWDGTTLSRTPVTLGAMGGGKVEVTRGLEAGDEVVLADVDQAITGASDTVNNRGGFGDNGPSLRFSGPGGGPPVTFSRTN